LASVGYFNSEHVVSKKVGCALHGPLKSGGRMQLNPA
jgi:hypothetical protein